MLAEGGSAQSAVLARSAQELTKVLAGRLVEALVLAEARSARCAALAPLPSMRAQEQFAFRATTSTIDNACTRVRVCSR